MTTPEAGAGGTTGGAGALGALLLADARLPTGGHAHSGSLEGAVAAGLEPKEVPAYIEARLRTVARTEAAAAVLARRAARATGGGGATATAADIDYGPIQAALAARTPSAPLRAASASLGRGLARLARRLRADHPAVLALPTASAPTPGLRPLRPVVLGALGAALDMADDQVARAALYDDAQTVASAALKLLPGDPVTAVEWVLDTGDALEEGVTAALAVTGPDRLPACSAPLIDQWAGAHAHATRRLFHA
ncbi:urease accessory protein [Nocardiopsis mwathae]|uniref:Urease accessory protein n=1 Tax=Nocardiopsis mwathae TaxID=1472723 RepID=A0A7X0D461_9ACTN|nr:urease accessory UreF family protein [Nocardiopsis mwathae]MBB6170750.1 urease accessory protein [Nocardiopsis mwathae]